MAFTTQALASVAYQVGNLAGHTLSMLDLQGTALRQVEARVSSLGQMVNMHLEKVARREIGTLAAVQRLYPGQKVLAPESLPPLTPYCRRPINFGCLDHVGHGVKVQRGPAPFPFGRLRQSHCESRLAQTLSTLLPQPHCSPKGPHPAPNLPYSLNSSFVSGAGSSPSSPRPPPTGAVHPEPPSGCEPQDFAPPLGDLCPPPPGEDPQTPPSLVRPGKQTEKARPAIGKLRQRDLRRVATLLLQPPKRWVTGVHHRPLPSLNFLMNRGVLPPSWEGSIRSCAWHLVPGWGPRRGEVSLSQIACACAGGGRRRLTLRLPAVVTLYPYTRRKDSELSFAEGTVICVTRRLSDGWCEGVSAEGAGLFPGNYVEPSC
ncbi:ABI gene family member 3 [Fukomys damarensis]|uniref:ABI gene family member 3 n=1 Tax=Fukomys damarensis TaxID=885580 RepID=UPI00053F2EE1|nr:ABI gene family member 3 [Fukomys damarensis]